MGEQTQDFQIRLTQMLQTAFGDTIAEALQNDDVTEILVNPDGCLWIETADHGRIKSPSVVSASDVERIIRLVASAVSADLHDHAPILSAELPETGERFEGVLPPIALAPTFAIRKQAHRIYTLDEYSAAGVLSASCKQTLKQALEMRSNILVVGGTGSGKTTLLNALLEDVSHKSERILILEDTRELQCAAADCVQLKTRSPHVTLSDLVRSSLRLRPDRIVVGEVRGAEALDMLKSWNTGHPGGLSTLHANSPVGGLYRLEQLIQEAIASVPRYLIAEAVDLIVFISGRGAKRQVESLTRVTGLDDKQNYQLEPCQAKTSSSLKTLSIALLVGMTFWLTGSGDVFAAGTGMPWEEPLDKILNSIQGPVARVIAVIIITLTGLSLAFGDTSGGFKRLIQIVFGLTIAFTAASFFLSFFKFAGGALIG